jgi:hypothetical protein
MNSKFTVESATFLIANTHDAVVVTILDYQTRNIYAYSFDQLYNTDLYTLLCDGFNPESPVELVLELQPSQFSIHVVVKDEFDKTLVLPFVGQMDNYLEVQVKHWVTDAVNKATK